MDLNIDDELVIKYYDLDEERRKMNEAVLKASKDRFVKEAREEGILESKKEIVMNMYNQNYKIEDIVSITNLIQLQVENIINESLKNNLDEN